MSKHPITFFVSALVGLGLVAFAPTTKMIEIGAITLTISVVLLLVTQILKEEK
ncbi:MAG: hypothetical protein KKD44_27475 [Proteobacteria bacterium]|nr:hypothetical protein [Pseudomonadota bacterium]